MYTLKKICAVSVWMISSAALAQEQGGCDISNLIVPSQLRSTVPFGDDTIETVMRAELNFATSRNGTVLITRTITTHLMSLVDKINARIALSSKDLPNNDCSTFAQVTNIAQGVAGTSYGVKVVVGATQWVCGTAPVPCHSELDAPAVVGPQFLAAGLFDVIPIPKKVPPVIKPPIDLIPPVIKNNLPSEIPNALCNQRVSKNKLASADIAIGIELVPSVVDNKPHLGVQKSVDSNINPDFAVVLTMLGDPEAFLLIPVIKGIVEDQAREKIDTLMTAPKVPELPKEIIKWRSTSAVFKTSTLESQPTVALVLTQEYVAPTRSVACFIRSTASRATL